MHKISLIVLTIFGFFISSHVMAASPWIACGKNQTKLVGEISKWGEVKCTNYGELITAKKGWAWSLPGGYRPIFLPAFNNISANANGKKFKKFKKVYFEKISGVEAKSAVTEINSYFSGVSDISPIIYKLTMVKASGIEVIVYFSKSKYNDIWGYTKTPEWSPNHPFMVINRNK